MKPLKHSPQAIDYLPVAGLIVVVLMLPACGSDSSSDDAALAATETPLEALGREIYFDENLSEPVGQSCASCHLPEAGFADPDALFPVSEGAVTGRFGARNAPTASYAALIPEFRFVPDGGGGDGNGRLDKLSALHIGLLRLVGGLSSQCNSSRIS